MKKSTFFISFQVALELKNIFDNALIPTHDLEYSKQKLKKDIEESLHFASQDKPRLLGDDEYKASWIAKLKTVYHFSMKCLCFAAIDDINKIIPCECHCKISTNKMCPAALEFYANQKLALHPRSMLFCEEDKTQFREMKGKTILS